MSYVIPATRCTEGGDEVLSRLRRLCLKLPETSERNSWGHPNFVAGKKTFVTYEWVQQRPSIAFHLAPEDVQDLAGKKGYFVTPFGRGQWISLWADGKLDWRLISTLIDGSYRTVAIKRMLAALDQSQTIPASKHRKN